MDDENKSVSDTSLNSNVMNFEYNDSIDSSDNDTINSSDNDTIHSSDNDTINSNKKIKNKGYNKKDNNNEEDGNGENQEYISLNADDPDLQYKLYKKKEFYIYKTPERPNALRR